MRDGAEDSKRTGRICLDESGGEMIALKRFETSDYTDDIAAKSRSQLAPPTQEAFGD